MNIRIKQVADYSVRVANRGTASFTKLADDLRDIDNADYKAFVKLAKLFRYADKKGAGWEHLDTLIHKARTLSDREFKTCTKLAKDLRKMDNELTKADELERDLKMERFTMAQINN